MLAAIYWSRTQLPDHVRIAGGPENGRYAQIADGLARELERRLGIRVDVLRTSGSLENLRLLESGKADLALYQSGSQLVLEGAESPDGSVAPVEFVSNLYPELLLPVGASDRPVRFLSDGEELVWSCNGRLSGDYAAARLLFEHLGLNEADIAIRSVNYVELPDHIRDGTVDVGVVCCGLQAPMLKTLLQPDAAVLVRIPAIQALARKHAFLKADTLPAGYFQASPMIPARDFPTVSLQAQLLAGAAVSVRLVEEVTAITADARFQRRYALTELLTGGTDYATDRPEYEIHPGASHIHHPGLKPLLNPDFVEGTEGLRSFLVSLIAAVWLLRRWWVRREIRSQEHRLDRYIRQLLKLELDQMEVDGEGGPEEARILQGLLDGVTMLRQEALAEFTAHELSEDRAVDCFIEMCHALSDKVNAKLTRHVILNARSGP